jgi:MFS family permease
MTKDLLKDKPMLPEPPRWLRWTILIFLGLAMFGNYYIYDSISPLAPVLKEQLGFTDDNIGTLNAVYSLPNIIMVLLSGMIIDRIGTRKATMIFAITCLIGAAITAFTGGGFWGMAAGRLVFGLGAESLIVTASVAIAKWFRGKEMSIAFAMKITLARLGSLAAETSPIWGKQMYESWQIPLFVAIGFGVACLAATIIYASMEGASLKKYALKKAKTEKISFKEMFSFGKSYWFIVALCATFYGAIFPFKTLATKYFIVAHGMGHEAASFHNSMTTWAALFFTPFFGMLADRIGKRATLMIIGSALLIPVYSLMGFGTIALFIPMAMMGLAYSLIPAVMWPSVAYVVDERNTGTAYGLMTSLQNIGLFAMNKGIGMTNDISGAGADNVDGYWPGLIIFTVLAASALVFAFLLKRNEKGPNAHGLETIKAKG